MKAILQDMRNVGQPVQERGLSDETWAAAHSGDGSERALRILFTVWTPWTTRLGVPRVSIELSKQLENLGHQCSHYSWEDAFPHGVGRLGSFFSTALFQWRLLDFLRRRARDFDVVQVECHTAPFPRAAYNFPGILVAKSNGLPLFYEQYRRSTELHLKRQLGARGTLGGNCLRALGRWTQGGYWGATLRTFAAADVIHVLNSDEQVTVAEESGFGRKVALVPNGLSQDFHAGLRTAGNPVARAASRKVAFVGTWGLRKGQAEFPALVRQVRAACPDASFHLLGTDVAEEKVLPAFDPQDRASVRVQPAYDPKELPMLLADAKAGVFPSYIEGFPLGALEMMAAGLPVVAWDVPGPRDFVPKVSPDLLIRAGDVPATAATLTRLLCQPVETYLPLSESALGAAQAYTWQRSAACFLDSLKPLLSKMQGATGVCRAG